MPRVSEIFRSKYLKSSDLQGRTVSATIESVETEEIGNPPEEKLVIYFQNNERGLVTNMTNATVLSNSFGDNTDEWVGRKIQLFCEPVFFQGKQTVGLRVKPIPGQDGEAGVRVRNPAPKPAAPVAAGAADPNDDWAVL